MSSAKTAPVQILAYLRFFMIVAAFLAVCMALPTSARAATLTDAQIRAVTILLNSFNVDSETVGAVNTLLRGEVVEAHDASDQRSGKDNSNYHQGGDSDNNSHGTTSPRSRDDNEKPEYPGASACGQMMRYLTKGDSGEEVARLQAYLQSIGDFDYATTTGYFGERTERALKRFQEREGIINNGSSSSTGYGFFGPKTRQILMDRCKESGGLRSTQPLKHSQQKSKENDASDSSKPSCTLRASKETITSGQSVTLRWESKNATWASDGAGGKGPVNGSVTITPTQTTTYIKLVYNENPNGPSSQGNCWATVEVVGTTPTTTQKVVVAPIIDLDRIFANVGSGMAAVFEAYLGLLQLN